MAKYFARNSTVRLSLAQPHLLGDASHVPVEQHDSVSDPDGTVLLDAAFEGLPMLERKSYNGHGRSVIGSKCSEDGSHGDFNRGDW